MLYEHKTILKEMTLTLKDAGELAALADIKGDFRPLFYDIETTGLSKFTTQLYLIGTVTYEKGHWMARQVLAEDLTSEKELLEDFIRFSSSFTHCIQFNGNRFDTPYIRQRCLVHGLSSPLDQMPALDLYQLVKPMKMLLQLNHLKQSDLECFLALPPRKYPDGKACIRHYQDYVSSKKANSTGDAALSTSGNSLDSSLNNCLNSSFDITAYNDSVNTPDSASGHASLQEVLGHNLEDLIGMLHVYKMLSYQGLMRNLWSFDSVEQLPDQLLFHLKLSYPVPAPLSGGIPGLYVKISDDDLKLLVNIQDGHLKQFYTDYRSYDYLPNEDTVIHKSLSLFVDKSLKEPATPETCYTWFTCDENFLEDPVKIQQYLSHAVPYLIYMLNHK